MCDQLSTVGVEFDLERMENIFLDDLRYAAAHPYPYVPSSLVERAAAHLHGRPHPKPWAGPGIFSSPAATATATGATGGLTPDATNCPGKSHCDRPQHMVGNEGGEKDGNAAATIATLWPTARPWALGQIRMPTSGLQLAAGKAVRRPGMGLRVDPVDNEDTEEPLLRTAERIHSSVRVRLACGGLGLDDKAVWPCRSLLISPKGNDDDYVDDDSDDNSKAGNHGDLLWRLERGSGFDEVEEAALVTFRPRELDISGGKAYPENKIYAADKTATKWRWVFAQKAAIKGEDLSRIPQMLVLPEEPLVGYWERLLLALTAGREDVWTWAEKNPPRQAMAAQAS